MKLSDFAIKHPAIVIISLISIVFFSSIAYTNLSSQFLPDITQPQAYIITTYPGVSAKRIDREVSKVIADILVTIPGIKDMSTDSQDSISIVLINFNEDENLDVLLPVIREKLNLVKDKLPSGITSDPEIHVASVATYLPIFTFTIQSDGDLINLTTFAKDTVKQDLFSVPGVSKVEVLGGKEEEIQIKLHLEKINAKGISVLSIVDILKSNNISIPSGSERYQNSMVNLRTSGEFKSLSEIENITIGLTNGVLIYLKDVATIEKVISKPDNYIINKGKDVPFIRVYRREGGDTVKIIEGLREKLIEISNNTGGSISFEITKDDSTVTEKSISSVISSALMGTLLAILIILLFLHNIKATLIIGITIPLSFLITFIGFYFTDISLNLLSLSGMTVALGMLVDPSIVVLENIHKKLDKGYSSIDASSIGAGEVGGAVIASATTSICVFAPLLFLTGVVGIFMGAVGKTMIFALSASVFVALIVVPFLTSKFLKEQKHTGISFTVSNWLGKILSKIDYLYMNILKIAIKNGFFVIFFVVCLLIISIWSLSTMGTSFIPPVDSGEFEVQVNLPDGYGLDQSRIKAIDTEKIILDFIPEIKTSLIAVDESSFTGYFTIVDKANRSRSVFDIISALQTELTLKVVNAEIKVRNAGMDSILALATGGQGFIIDITGNNLDDLEVSGKQIQEILASDPRVISTEMSLKRSRKEIVTNLLLEKMGSLGITPYEAAITSRIFFSGEKAGVYTDNNKDLDIKIVSDLHGKPVTMENLQNMTLVSRSGEQINFSTFSNIEIVTTLDNVKTMDRQYSVKVTGLLNTGETGGITASMKKSLEVIDFPIGVKWSIGGSAGLWSDSLGSLLLVLTVAIFLVYMVMVIQFERFTQPLIIMASIPFCIIGVVFGLNIFGSNMSIIAFLALISLGGIVVNNAIVLIDYINMLRKDKSIALMEAIMQAGSSRIQPILMTTFTTMLGVIPMALGKGEGADMYAPLGQAIFGGLISSTLVTLILIPVLYFMLEKRRDNKIELRSENA